MMYFSADSCLEYTSYNNHVLQALFLESSGEIWTDGRLEFSLQRQVMFIHDTQASVGKNYPWIPLTWIKSCSDVIFSDINLPVFFNFFEKTSRSVKNPILGKTVIVEGLMRVIFLCCYFLEYHSWNAWSSTGFLKIL